MFAFTLPQQYSSRRKNELLIEPTTKVRWTFFCNMCLSLFGTLSRSVHWHLSYVMPQKRSDSGLVVAHVLDKLQYTIVSLSITHLFWVGVLMKKHVSHYDCSMFLVQECWRWRRGAIYAKVQPMETGVWNIKGKEAS